MVPHLSFAFICSSYVLLYNGLKLNAGELPQLTNHVLQMTYTGRPVCAYFKRKASLESLKYEGMLSNFLNTKVAIKYAEWKIGSVKIEDIHQIATPSILYPRHVPSLQCDIGLELPLEFIFQNKSTKSLKKWFKHVSKQHLSQPKLVTTSSEMENVILKNHDGITVLIITEKEYIHLMKDTMRKVGKIQLTVQLEVLVTRPEYFDSWKQKGLFHKPKKYPSVLFFTYKDWVPEKSFTYVLQGQLEASANSIKLALMAIAAKFVFMDEERFLEEILDTTYQLPPKLLFVFSHSNPDSLKYFLAFEKLRQQLECEGVPLEFRLMDIGKRHNSLVISRHINGTKINQFPVFVLFWQEVTEKYEIKVRHDVVNDLLTADQLLSVLVKNKILNKWEKNYRNFQCIEEDDYYGKECVNLAYSRGVCEANETVVINEHNAIRNSAATRLQKKLKKSTKRRKIGNLTVLSDHDWSAVIECSRFSTSTNRLQRMGDSPHISLVFFIVKKCRYCEIVMPKIEKLSQTIRSSEKASVYLVNCSLSPTVCKHQNIQGFPSVKLFRSVVWSRFAGCATDYIRQQYIALDYHRPLEPVEFILEWFSNSSLPSVKKDFLLTNIPKQLNHDVYLIGTVITRSQALRFLPVETRKKWYPYTCFQTACELLFGKATCYVTMTKDFGVTNDMSKTKNKDLFLIKLDVFRSDNIKARIFELGIPLETTMYNQQDSKLHKFHNAHSYSLKKGFRCEDNHSQCTEFIVKFVRDHSRLPITRLSHDGFHTINRLSRDPQSQELPVVVVLAHKENMTKQSSYLMEITKAAYELYRHVIFTSLDVDEYPWWATRFVPRDYDTTPMIRSLDLEYIPPLYHYPRLCIVRMLNHRQAAFLPSLERMDTAKNIPKLLKSVKAREIVKFVKRYLKNPKSLLVETEEF